MDVTKSDKKVGKKHFVFLNIPYIVGLIQEDAIEPKTKIRIEVTYPVKT